MTFIDIFTDSLLAIEYFYQYNNRYSHSSNQVTTDHLGMTSVVVFNLKLQTHTVVIK